MNLQPVNEQGDLFFIKEVDEDSIGYLSAAKSFSGDLETTGLIPKLGKPRLVQVYIPKCQTVYYLDLWSDLAVSKIGLNFLSTLLIKVADPGVIKVWHNALFDMQWIYHHFGVMSVNNFDTMVASQLMKAGQYFGYAKAFQITPNSLKFLIQEFGFTHDKDVDHEIWKKSGALPEWAINYACRDAFYTYIIGKYWRSILLQQCPEVLESEMGVLPAFVEMNNNGLPCDPDYLKQMIEEYDNKAIALELDLVKRIKLSHIGSGTWFKRYYAKKALPKKYEKPGALDRELNNTLFKPGSSQSVGRWLCDFVPVEALERRDTKTDKVTIRTDKSMLFILSTLYDQPALRELIYYRSIKGAASKFKSYLESYQEDTGSIAVSYTVLARQGTGRSSSGKKKSKDEAIKFHNGQNFSKYLPSHAQYKLQPTRSIIQARPGYTLAEFDSSASHLQYARWLSQDESLIQSNESGIKVHFYTLASILRHSDGMFVSPEEAKYLVSDECKDPNKVRFKHYYKLGKNVIYSFLNRAGAATLQQQFFKQEVFVSLEDCQLYLDACADQYWGLLKFQDQTFERVRRTLKAYYVNDKYIGHFVRNTHLDGAITYHQAKIKQSAYDRFWETIGELDDDDPLEADLTDEYERIGQLAKSMNALYVKPSDVIAACWLRPEATVMKRSLKIIHDLQLTGDYDFRVLNYSHDSYLLEIRKEEVEPVASYAFRTQEEIHKKFVPDYKSEDTWRECVLGQYWEAPKKFED